MIIAFECPEEIIKHPSVRAEKLAIQTPMGAWETTAKAFIVGCKSCQKVLTECQCGERRQTSELLIYDRDKGELGVVFRKFVPELYDRYTNSKG